MPTTATPRRILFLYSDKICSDANIYMTLYGISTAEISRFFGMSLLSDTYPRLFLVDSRYLTMRFIVSPGVLKVFNWHGTLMASHAMTDPWKAGLGSFPTNLGTCADENEIIQTQQPGQA